MASAWVAVLLSSVVVAGAQLTQGGGGGAAAPTFSSVSVSPPCAAELKALSEEKARTASGQCEKEGGYSDKVLAHLRKGEEDQAIAVTEETFIKCGKMTPTCAGEVAPGVVQEVRFSGLAVTDECRNKVRANQKDEKIMAGVNKCETENQVAQKLLGALNGGDLDGAVGAAEMSLETCMKLSEECSFQIAPVLVNQVVTMAMMQQGGMMPVFVAKTLDAVAEAPASRTLLAAALATRRPLPKPAGKAGKAGSPMLLQQRSRHRVAHLILQLARRH